MGTHELLRVCIEDDVSFEALVDRTERWNGWLAFPWFDRVNAQAVMDYVNEREDMPILEWDGVRIKDTTYPEDPPTYYEPRSHDGTQRWPIGAYAWVWSEASIGREGEPARSEDDIASIVRELTRVLVAWIGADGRVLMDHQVVNEIWTPREFADEVGRRLGRDNSRAQGQTIDTGVSQAPRQQEPVMKYENLGPVVNPDGTPSQTTIDMLAGTGRDPQEFARAVAARAAADDAVDERERRMEQTGDADDQVVDDPGPQNDGVYAVEDIVDTLRGIGVAVFVIEDVDRTL